MLEVMRKLGFTGTVQEFLEKLRENNEMYYPKGELLLSGFRDILRKMDEALPRLFGRLPNAAYGFREIEAYRAEAAPEAYYYAPPEDGSRPGYFYVNTFRPETRPKYTMESLAYHEAVPGPPSANRDSTRTQGSSHVSEAWWVYCVRGGLGSLCGGFAEGGRVLL